MDVSNFSFVAKCLRKSLHQTDPRHSDSFRFPASWMGNIRYIPRTNACKLNIDLGEGYYLLIPCLLPPKRQEGVTMSKTLMLMLGKGNSLETMVLKTIVIWILVLDPLEKISGKMDIISQIRVNTNMVSNGKHTKKQGCAMVYLAIPTRAQSACSKAASSRPQRQGCRYMKEETGFRFGN